MRKRLTSIVALTALVALAIAATASAVLTAPDGNTQSIQVASLPKRLSRTRPAPITLEVTTRTSTVTNPNGVPVPAVEAVIDFDRSASIFAKGYPTCEAALLQSTTTETAMRLCGRAKIGAGTATALIAIGETVFTENLVVTAFNGKPQGGRPVVLLHSYGRAPVQTTAVLVGVTSRYDREGYGPRLDVSIPLIAGGTGALTDFHASIFKKFTYKGVKRSYVTAMCKTGRLKARGKFVYRDGQSLTPNVTQRCVKAP